MNTDTAVRAHSRAKPYAARKFAVCKDILADLKAEREAHFHVEMKKMERRLNRLVAFNCRENA